MLAYLGWGGGGALLLTVLLKQLLTVALGPRTTHPTPTAGMGRLAQFQAYMNGKPAAPGSATRAEVGGSSSKKQQQKKRRMSAPVPGGSSRPRASEFF